FFTAVQGSHAKLGNIYLSIRAFEVGGGLGIVFADITEQKQAEEQIQRDLKEKTTLLQEIHHRVKNNLQIISSLLNLQSNKIENQSCLFALQVSMRRINSMALIHEKLYRSENLSSINFTDYIKSLAQHLLKSYDNKGKHIELKFNLDKIFLGIDTAIPCGLILNELITNSLKHAFLKNRKGKISISFTRLKNKTYTLRVSDNGVGIAESIDYLHNDSLGLTLIRTLADQIEGEAIFENKNGTVCTLNFMGYEYGKTKYSNS
ncbi:MAG: sensor histidine kinase, partial [bacterium]